MSGVVAGFTVIFLVIGIGYGLGRSGTLGPTATDVLSRLVFFVCTPALLFHSLVSAANCMRWKDSCSVACVPPVEHEGETTPVRH